jgi:hypothetical protein
MAIALVTVYRRAFHARAITSRRISVIQASCDALGAQPVAVGSPENPQPGIYGITKWKASDALPPCAAGNSHRLRRAGREFKDFAAPHG